MLLKSLQAGVSWLTFIDAIFYRYSVTRFIRLCRDPVIGLRLSIITVLLPRLKAWEVYVVGYTSQYDRWCVGITSIYRRYKSMWMYRVGAECGLVTDWWCLQRHHVKDDHRITLLAVSITDCVINVWLRWELLISFEYR